MSILDESIPWPNVIGTDWTFEAKVHDVDALGDINEPLDIDVESTIRLPLFIFIVPYKLTAELVDPIVIGFAVLIEPVPILMAPVVLLSPVPIFNIPSYCYVTMLKSVSEIGLMVDE